MRLTLLLNALSSIVKPDYLGGSTLSLKGLMCFVPIRISNTGYQGYDDDDVPMPSVDSNQRLLVSGDEKGDGGDIVTHRGSLGDDGVLSTSLPMDDCPNDDISSYSVHACLS